MPYLMRYMPPPTDFKGRLINTYISPFKTIEEFYKERSAIETKIRACLQHTVNNRYTCLVRGDVNQLQKCPMYQQYAVAALRYDSVSRHCSDQMRWKFERLRDHLMNAIVVWTRVYLFGLLEEVDLLAGGFSTVVNALRESPIKRVVPVYDKNVIRPTGG